MTNEAKPVLPHHVDLVETEGDLLHIVFDDQYREVWIPRTVVDVPCSAEICDCGDIKPVALRQCVRCLSFEDLTEVSAFFRTEAGLDKVRDLSGATSLGGPPVVPREPAPRLTPEFIDEAMHKAPEVVREVQEQLGERPPRDFFGQLCDMVKKSGLKMTLFGKPIDEAGLRTAATQRAVDRIVDAVVGPTTPPSECTEECITAGAARISTDGAAFDVRTNEAHYRITGNRLRLWCAGPDGSFEGRAIADAWETHGVSDDPAVRSPLPEMTALEWSKRFHAEQNEMNAFLAKHNADMPEGLWTWTHDAEAFTLRRHNGQAAATVWINGTWHTWNTNGTGGENWTEPTVDAAMVAAMAAVKRQGWDVTPEDEDESEEECVSEEDVRRLLAVIRSARPYVKTAQRAGAATDALLASIDAVLGESQFLRLHDGTG